MKCLRNVKGYTTSSNLKKEDIYMKELNMYLVNGRGDYREHWLTHVNGMVNDRHTKLPFCYKTKECLETVRNMASA
jgi:hypothetical protein